jgi:glycosyltransferase involved in cell wall biosynthesis
MRILLLYNGYPRLSHPYQYEEANELHKRHELLIISWGWKLYSTLKDPLPYIHDHPLQQLEAIKAFSPDHIHAHYLNNIGLCEEVAKKLGVGYTIRTHSFDILGEQDFHKYKGYIEKDVCKGIFVFPGFVAKFIEAKIDSTKIVPSYPLINMDWFSSIEPNGRDIMSGGCILPKKNLEGFIDLATKIKQRYPNYTITYYGIDEDPIYYEKLKKYNKRLGSPVLFKTVDACDMGIEYKKHQWLIYTACPKLQTVGYPCMIAEAQCSGVGVIMYKLREDLEDYVTENGYLYTKDEEVLEILAEPFSEEKRQKALLLKERYDLSKHIQELEDRFL